MLELLAVEQAIGSLLINRGFVPAGTPIEPAPYEEQAAYPAIVYKPITTKDVIMTGGSIVMATVVYQVVAVVEGWNIGAAKSLATQIHQSLHGQSSTNSDGTVLSILRERTVSVPYKTQSAKALQMLGGWYSFNVRSVYP